MTDWLTHINKVDSWLKSITFVRLWFPTSDVPISLNPRLTLIKFGKIAGQLPAVINWFSDAVAAKVVKKLSETMSNLVATNKFSLITQMLNSQHSPDYEWSIRSAIVV